MFGFTFGASKIDYRGLELIYMFGCSRVEFILHVELIPT